MFCGCRGKRGGRSLSNEKFCKFSLGILGRQLADHRPMPSSRYADTVAPEPPPKPKRLEQRLAEAVRARGFTLETEKAYGMWTRQFILHFDVRHPDEMGGAEVQEFLTHLAVDRELRGSSQA